MARTTKKAPAREADNAYFLKILIYFILGTIWIKFYINDNGVPLLPIGLILGIFIAQHDHFAIDRKIEYAILLVSAVLGLAGWGFYLAL